MTTQPGECARSAESCGAGVWACAVSAAINNVASANERATIRDSLMDERMEFLDGFDLLMENASHSKRIYGDTNLRSRWGTAVRWGHNCSGREQKPESALQSRARLSGLRPTGGRWSKNGVAGFLAGKIAAILWRPDLTISLLR